MLERAGLQARVTCGTRHVYLNIYSLCDIKDKSDKIRLCRGFTRPAVDRVESFSRPVTTTRDTHTHTSQRTGFSAMLLERLGRERAPALLSHPL